MCGLSGIYDSTKKNSFPARPSAPSQKNRKSKKEKKEKKQSLRVILLKQTPSLLPPALGLVAQAIQLAKPAALRTPGLPSARPLLSRFERTQRFHFLEDVLEEFFPAHDVQMTADLWVFAGELL